MALHRVIPAQPALLHQPRQHQVQHMAPLLRRQRRHRLVTRHDGRQHVQGIAGSRHLVGRGNGDLGDPRRVDHIAEVQDARQFRARRIDQNVAGRQIVVGALAG
ncbi:hypothetical protein G6F23_015159 [Rhizopus arrhizus]|nr:hypothetical protein G6F23_015159 [Rhizopus arrhizus]